MSRNITLNDVAKVLGLSKATVSLSIRNDPRIAEKTRKRVIKKAGELGYVYNRGAAGLTTGKTNTIGIAVFDLTNPYFAEVCSAIESVFGENDILSFLCNTNESLERQNKFIEGLIEHRADGLILCPTVNTDVNTLKHILDRRLPTVLIVRDIEGAPLDYIGNDGHLATKLATEHLIKLGHTRIALIGGGHNTSSARNRRYGFYSTVNDHNITIDASLIIDCDLSPEGGEESIRKILHLPSPPTAVVCLNDLVALGVLSGLHHMNLTPGKDIAITSCDDITEASRGYIQLTTASIKKGAIGQKAAETLLERIANPQLPLKKINFKPELIVRKSCGNQVS